MEVFCFYDPNGETSGKNNSKGQNPNTTCFTSRNKLKKATSKVLEGHESLRNFTQNKEKGHTKKCIEQALVLAQNLTFIGLYSMRKSD